MQMEGAYRFPLEEFRPFGCRQINFSDFGGAPEGAGSLARIWSAPTAPAVSRSCWERSASLGVIRSALGASRALVCSTRSHVARTRHWHRRTLTFREIHIEVSVSLSTFLIVYYI